jgi:ribokinase
MKILVVGSLNIDFRIAVRHLVADGETEKADELELIPGGKGANQAFASGKLGNQTVLLGAVGNDSYGKILCNSLRTAGVDISHLAVCDTVSTGIAVIQVDSNGNNSIIVVSGANAAVSTEYVDKNIDVLKQSDIVLLQMEIPVETVLYVAQLAKKMGKIVILDPSPVPAVMPHEIYRYIDYIKPNETELQMLTDERELIKGMQKLISFGVGCVIVTVGRNGAKVLNSTQDTVVTYPTPDVPIVDTTAAGDSFLAAFATALGSGMEVKKAVKYANIVGAIVVSKKGAQTSIPDRKEVADFTETLDKRFI